MKMPKSDFLKLFENKKNVIALDYIADCLIFFGNVRTKSALKNVKIERARIDPEEVAEFTELNRREVRAALERLVKYGIVSKVKRKGKNLYYLNASSNILKAIAILDKALTLFSLKEVEKRIKKSEKRSKKKKRW